MDQFLGEIRAVGFNYAPKGWALCQGQLMPIAQNAALYSIIGNFYGGDGRSTFALPDLRGRVVVNPGQGPGLSSYSLGQKNGTESETLLLANLPAHTHNMGSFQVSVNSGQANNPSPTGNLLAGNTTVEHYNSEANVQMGPNMLSGVLAPVGGGGPHANIMPVLAVSYIIALQGEFPIRP